MRARLAFGSSVVFLVLVIFVFHSPASHGGPTTSQVSEALTCQCGCGLTVANCNMPTCGFSVPRRHEIDTMIAKGMSRAQIIGVYRAKYGEKVLSAPTTEGFNLLAWTMPFIAIVLGGGAMAFALGRWRSRGPSESKPAGAATAAFDPELRRKLEHELEEQR